MKQIIITDDVAQELSLLLSDSTYDHIFILADDNTQRLCLPRIESIAALREAQQIVVPAGDEHKDLRSAALVWGALQEKGASRRSLLVNLGGGMLTDLGGFCAACFKRGLTFINIPTTLLAMVDASVGGKTGVNFRDIKNEIGVFANPLTTLIDPSFLTTLSKENILSGLAEMLKHGLLSDKATLFEILNLDFSNSPQCFSKAIIEKAVEVKAHIVEQDPREQHLRKALNFGHTIGHAIEELSLQKNRPMLHGYAVAFGMVAELYLSATKKHFPLPTMRQIVSFIRENYGAAPILCDDYDALVTLMKHDKKNTGSTINFTLLSDVGAVELDNSATKEELLEALDFLTNGL